MIYFIGGPPRCGKSILARKILEKTLAPYVATDTLVHMLKKAAPELGITDKINIEIRAEKFYPFLYQFAKLASYDSHGYIIEGDVVWPSQVKRIEEKLEVRPVFLGFESITLNDIIDHVGSNTWIMEISEEDRKNMPGWLSDMSIRFKEECEKFGYKYIDLSGDFEGKMKEAEDYLLGSK